MGLRIGGKVERVNGRDLSYKSFVENYLKKNQPVVLTGLMDDWRACRDWVMEDGLPNLQFFSTHFGKSIVQVADCCTKEFTDQKRLEMSVSEFVNHWLELLAKKHSHDLNCNRNTESLLYLKDWHFVKEYPEYVAYTTPPLFLDDWLNLYLDSHRMHRDSDIPYDKNEISCSDYRFVYMGAKGTWTPLHADVFRSYSWSANVCGKKLWLFLPPSQCHLVFDRNFKMSVYDVYSDVPEMNFPDFKKAIWWECTQERNEIVFVPSGWFHQVHNLEDTISINHNWFNAYNLSWVWNLLVKDYNEAKGYIEDVREICDDFESLCQRNLAANTGMNYYDLFVFITRVALANLTLLYNHTNDEGVISHSPSKAHHLITNLISIRTVAFSMESAEAFAGEDLKCCSVANLGAFSDIKKITGEPDFLELCMAISRTYKHIDKEQERLHKERVKPVSNGKLEFIKTCCSKICNPKDLVRVIEQAISNYDIICGDCKLSLPSDILNSETLGIKEMCL